MIAQAGAAHVGDFGLRGNGLTARRNLICAQSRKRLASQLAVVFGHFAKQLEKQRQRPRRMLMLHCTIVR